MLKKEVIELSLTPEHIKKSLEEIEKNQPEFFAQNKETIKKLITELHIWFDLFSLSPFAELYGYTEDNDLRHREQRHHFKGIEAAEWVFTKKYGKIYAPIILSESCQHIKDDFPHLDDIDKIPLMEDWLNSDFRKKAIGF
ncbi:hypothetical protein JW977_00610 [Candidatus Falkowbacteria bacterium]|nr:hypothetical protein [Candidatus Falkowbacteria bacterium]